MKQSTRRDIVTATLFLLWGPFIGVVVTGAIQGGFWGAVTAPIAVAFLIAMFRWAALLAFLLLSVGPALVSIGCAIFASLANLPCSLQFRQR